jgi:enamine deaminase RidA (YjgF/YER057c/UK114 family)
MRRWASPADAAPSPTSTSSVARVSERVSSGSTWERAYGYSRAVRSGSTIHVAGTVAVPRDGETVAESARDQMLRCGAVALDAVEKLGGSVADVVRTRMYLTDGADAEAVGLAHAELFGSAAPASTMLVVAALVSPGYRVDLEVEAVVESG